MKAPRDELAEHIEEAERALKHYQYEALSYSLTADSLRQAIQLALKAQMGSDDLARQRAIKLLTAYTRKT